MTDQDPDAENTFDFFTEPADYVSNVEGRNSPLQTFLRDNHQGMLDQSNTDSPILFIVPPVPNTHNTNPRPALRPHPHRAPRRPQPPLGPPPLERRASNLHLPRIAPFANHQQNGLRTRSRSWLTESGMCGDGCEDGGCY